MTHVQSGRQALRAMRHVPASRQGGVILVIALIVLVLVTILGVSTLRTTTIQEKMAGNSRDRDKALQAAEAAVQACLAEVAGGTYALPLAPSATGTPARWDVAANWTDNTKSKEVTVATAGGLFGNPRCMVEALDAAKGSYRVTGRAVGGSEQTVVMLQATMSEE